MQYNTAGIVLRQIKIPGDRRMLSIFTERFGKISVSVAGNKMNGKNKGSLAFKPFTLGNYDIYTGRDYYSLGKAETVKSWFGIGEDVDRYLEGSFILEFTEKLLEESVPSPHLFALLKDYFDVLEKRTRAHSFLTTAFQIKAVSVMGVAPEVESCVICGKKYDDYMFVNEAGGCVCRNCISEVSKRDNPLIYRNDSAIIDRIRYLIRTPMKKLEKIYLEEESLGEINRLIREYSRYHLDINELKSERVKNV